MDLKVRLSTGTDVLYTDRRLYVRLVYLILVRSLIFRLGPLYCRSDLKKAGISLCLYHFLTFSLYPSVLFSHSIHLFLRQNNQMLSSSNLVWSSVWADQMFLDLHFRNDKCFSSQMFFVFFYERTM